MKLHLFSLFPFLACILLSQNNEFKKQGPSPLAVFSAEWNDVKFLNCNTAATTHYLSDHEKEVIYILNLLRADPKLFANTVVEKYPEYNNQLYLKNIPEYKSLLETLRNSKPLSLLYPDSLCFESAKCHALYSGKMAYVGHERKTEECKVKKHYEGECCQYGYEDALSILMDLLIDQNVPSLGHRFLCLSDYARIGVSIQPHTGYGHNTVVDFYY